MTRKRLLCAVTALVLLISAQPAAMAASNERSTIITTTTKMPTINVTVPSKGSVVINPLSLPVSISGEESTEQIVCTPRCLVNKSDISLTVDITVTGAIKDGSGMKLASSPTNGAGTDKEAFIYFEIHQADSEDTDHVEWDDEYDPTQHIVVMNNTSVIKTDMLTLPAKTLDGEIAPGGYAPFRLAGDAVRDPDTAWKKADGINVVIAFTFTPIPFS